MQDRVKSAMRYPLIVMIVISVAIVILTTFVIPKFAPLFRVLGNDIPWPTRDHHGRFELRPARMVRRDRRSWPRVVIAARQYVSTERGRYQWHRLKLRCRHRATWCARRCWRALSRSLSMSLTAGMPMIQTLNLHRQIRRQRLSWPSASCACARRSSAVIP